MKKSKTGKVSIIAAVAFVVIVLGFGYFSLQPSLASDSNLEDVPVFTVKQGPLKISVVESGTIRPRDEFILRNNTDDQTTIVSIVPEGKQVKKGDVVALLDASEKEDRLHTQQLELKNDQTELISARENLDIVRNQSQSDTEQAELLFKFAQQDLEKYTSGEYPKQLMEAEASITLASQRYTLAKEDLKWSKVLYEKKYLAESELQQDELSAKSAELDLELAKEDLELLKNYTHLRQLEQLKSDVKQAEFELERTHSRASSNILEASSRYYWRQERVARETRYVNELQKEIQAATMVAPIDGLALYASSVLEDWEDDEDRIRVGAVVDEEREILFITAAEEYNIDIMVQETDLNKVAEGLPVTITVDALPGSSFQGVVKKVAPLPNQRQQYLNPNLKVYNTDIEISSDSSALRNGMSCMVDILIEEYENVLYVPVQAVIKANGQSLVFVKNNTNIEARLVTIGLDNNRMIHIKEGLKEGELVLLKPPLNYEDDEEALDLSKEPTDHNELASAR